MLVLLVCPQNHRKCIDIDYANIDLSNICANSGVSNICATSKHRAKFDTSKNRANLRVLHWFTHSCLRKYSQVTAPDVGMGFAYATSVPMLAATRVGTSLALATSVPSSLVLFTLTWGWACVKAGGGGLPCVYYSCSHSGSQEGKIR